MASRSAPSADLPKHVQTDSLFVCLETALAAYASQKIGDTVLNRWTRPTDGWVEASHPIFGVLATMPEGTLVKAHKHIGYLIVSASGETLPYLLCYDGRASPIALDTPAPGALPLSAFE